MDEIEVLIMKEIKKTFLYRYAINLSNFPVTVL